MCRRRSAKFTVQELCEAASKKSRLFLLSFFVVSKLRSNFIGDCIFKSLNTSYDESGVHVPVARVDEHPSVGYKVGAGVLAGIVHEPRPGAD
jgi:hypothetical protein